MKLRVNYKAVIYECYAMLIYWNPSLSLNLNAVECLVASINLPLWSQGTLGLKCLGSLLATEISMLSGHGKQRVRVFSVIPYSLFIDVLPLFSHKAIEISEKLRFKNLLSSCLLFSTC